MSSDDVKNAIPDDIRVIASNSLDRDTWTTVLALFKTKWETAEFEDEELPRRIKVFLAYFFESWVFDADKANWWQGMNPHHKVNNCALEGVNSTIKRLYTKHEKLDLGHLIDEMSRYLVDHLRESKRDVKQKHTEAPSSCPGPGGAAQFGSNPRTSSQEREDSDETGHQKPRSGQVRGIDSNIGVKTFK